MLEAQQTKETQAQPPTKVEKTWFLKRGDGYIFPVTERSAWDLLYCRNWNSINNEKFTIVGVSDGTTYVKMLKEGEKARIELERELQSKSREVTRYMQTLDRFKFDELLSDSDEKVVKVTEIINKLNAEIDELNARLNQIQKEVVTKAFEAELAKATGNIEQPQNFDVLTPIDKDRNKILAQLGKK